MTADLPKAEIEGLVFTFVPPGDREQFEIECILAGLLAPGAAVGVAELAKAMAVEIAKIVRDVCLDETLDADSDDPPAPWDLARVLSLRVGLDTRDPRLKTAWDAFTDALPALAGDLIAKLTPEITDRLEHGLVARLFELSVLGSTFVNINGAPMKIETFKAFGTLASRGRWSMKWQVMAAALGAVYLAPKPAESPEPDEAE